MRFEWDKEKNEVNIRKHGIDFSDAPEIFDGPILIWLDTRQDYGEDRWCAIGITNGRIVKVVFTERGKNATIRIISLRKANKHEREKYRKELLH
ncbi:MAG: BrnT family toxin [bacterium]|nr:BrnT family toxin [bacterium]